MDMRRTQRITRCWQASRIESLPILLAETILANVCSDSNAESGSYGRSGRFGSEEAIARLRAIVSTFGSNESP